MTLVNLCGRIFNTPLLIHPDKAEIILSAVILPKLRGEVVPQALAPAQRTAAPATRAVQGANIGLLPVNGTLVRRAGGMDAQSGLLSYDAIAQDLRTLAADPSVSGILLAIDSPGGEVAGLADMAALVRSVAKAKPVYAVADHQATSAAYWLASAADRVFVTEDSLVGSIGVMAMHVDQSGFDAQQGFAYTPIFAGARKADVTSHAPLNEEGRAFLQQAVDRTYERFTAAVARNRGIPQQAVRATEAAVYLGRDAIGVGLADQVGNVDQAASALAKEIRSRRSGDASTTLPGAPARQPARGPRAHVIRGTTMTAQLTAGGDPVQDDEFDPAQERTTNNPAPEPAVTDPEKPAGPPAQRPQGEPARPEGGGDTAATGTIGAWVEPQIVASAREQERTRAVRLIRFCATAGDAAAAADFIEKGTPFDQVAEAMVARMATAQARSAISTAHAARPAAPAPVPVPNPTDVYAARARAVGQA